MADIPDGIDNHVAKMAIAWEIVKTTTLKWAISENATPESRLREVTNAYIKAYKAIVNEEPIQEETKQ